MNMEDPNATKKFAEVIKKRFAGDQTPVTMEMLSDVWAEFVIMQDMMVDIARLLSTKTSPEDKAKHYFQLATGLQSSLDHLSSVLKELPDKVEEINARK